MHFSLSEAKISPRVTEAICDMETGVKEQSKWRLRPFPIKPGLFAMGGAWPRGNRDCRRHEGPDTSLFIKPQVFDANELIPT